MQFQTASPATPRVALVSGGLPLGGSTTFLCNLGGELVKRAIPVLVLSLESENPLAADFAARAIPVAAQDQRRLVFEDRLQNVLEQLRTFRPTVVVATLGALSFEVLRYVPAGVLRIGMVQADSLEVYQLVDRYARHLDLVVGVSRRVVETLSTRPALGAVAKSYLPYGVTVPPIIPARDLCSQKPLRLLYLGRLDQDQKRVRLFPRILRELQAAQVAFSWTIVGDGPDRAYLEREMRGGDPRQPVRFTGPVAYAAVPQYWSTHDVFLLASDYEGLPLSLLEAMGHGLVPVVSDLPSGIREVVDETTGKLVAVADLEGYARAIQWLDQHRAEMTAMARQAHQKVRATFSVEAMTDRWLTLLGGRDSSAAPWPSPVVIQPLLGSRNPLRSAAPVRSLRRLGKKLWNR